MATLFLPHNIYIILSKLGVLWLPLVMPPKMCIPTKIRISNRTNHIIAVENKLVCIFGDISLGGQRE